MPQTLKLSDLRAGDALWIEHHGPHPGIVIHVTGRAALIALGTGTSRPHLHADEICVEERTRAGMALRYSKPTYFTSANYVLIRDTSAIVGERRRCPPGLFQKFAAAFEEVVRRELASKGQDPNRGQ